MGQLSQGIAGNSQRQESVENLLRKFLPMWVAERMFESEALPFVEGQLRCLFVF